MGPDTFTLDQTAVLDAPPEAYWRHISTAPTDDPAALCRIKAVRRVSHGYQGPRKEQVFEACRPLRTSTSAWRRLGVGIRWSSVPADFVPTHWMPADPTSPEGSA